MHSATTIASGVLTTGCFIAAVKYQMDGMKQRKEREEVRDGTMPPAAKRNMRVKYVLMVSTVLFGALFVYQLMSKNSPGSSYLPSSSMHKYHNDADFTKRVSEATSRLRQKLNQSSTRSHAPSHTARSRGPSYTAHSMHDAPVTVSNDASVLAARASAEISSFIANNL